jgi:ankyrin repeat protein
LTPERTFSAKDDNGETPLHHIGPLGDAGCFSELLNAGANPKEKSNEGVTPLHKAAEMGRADVALLLLNAGVEINARDNEGRTPLDMAANPGPLVTPKRSKATITLLKKRAAGTERRQKNG